MIYSKIINFSIIVIILLTRSTHQFPSETDAVEGPVESPANVTSDKDVGNNTFKVPHGRVLDTNEENYHTSETLVTSTTSLKPTGSTSTTELTTSMDSESSTATSSPVASSSLASNESSSVTSISIKATLPVTDPPVPILGPDDHKASTWTYLTISLLIGAAMSLTVIYFGRLYILRKRKRDQRHLLRSRSSLSQEGYFYGSENYNSVESL